MLVLLLNLEGDTIIVHKWKEMLRRSISIIIICYYTRDKYVGITTESRRGLYYYSQMEVNTLRDHGIPRLIVKQMEIVIIR